MSAYSIPILNCLFLLFFHFSCFAENLDKTTGGVLIVTFQTGPDAERLDRVRFFIKDAEGEQEMYPTGEAYVDDPDCAMRMVVVEELKPGNYTLEFVIPNADGLFLEIPKREFSIAKECVTKIDQIFKRNPNRIKIKE